MNPRRTQFAAAVVLWSSAVGPARCAMNVSASGYAKNLYEYTASPLSHGAYNLDLTRLRTTLDASVGLGPNAKSDEAPLLKAHVDYDHEVRAGSYYQSLDYRLFGSPEPPQYFSMEQTISTGNSYTWRHLLYRAWAGVDSKEQTLRFGRQRVAWGTGKLWNPTDVLNPYQPTSIERDERRGVDALYYRKGVGTLGQGEGVWALGDRWASTSLLARARGHRGDADVSVMGGKVAGSTSSWMGGGDFSSNLLDGNLHGELTYTDLRTRTPYWRGMFGYEYSFASDSALRPLRDGWVLVEYFHNGNGALDRLKYNPAALLNGTEVAMAQDYLGTGFQENVHPLVDLEIYQILNLDDRSHFLNVSANWNAVPNLYLLAGLQRFAGSSLTEFGRLPNILYLQGQYYF